MNVKRIDWEDVEWINLALRTNKLRDFMNTIMNFRVP